MTHYFSTKITIIDIFVYFLLSIFFPTCMHVLLLFFFFFTFLGLNIELFVVKETSAHIWEGWGMEWGSEGGVHVDLV